MLSSTVRHLGKATALQKFLSSSTTQKIFQTESTEVQVTRRVYRNGDSEYLINRKICRLKDIKDLFMGSGAGSDAYCIIEQGKVDGLLQSSPKERRIIFDEAAGISRFKVKNLNRFADLSELIKMLNA